MKNVLTISDADVIEGRARQDTLNYRIRKAARAVVLDGENRVALLHSRTHNYHKLPGGGVEDFEDMQLALARELLEEIGCKARVLAEVGEVVEFRDEWQLKQVSHCYIARQFGEQVAPILTESEIEEGFETVWANDIDAAIALLEQDVPSHYDGYFMLRRDVALLRAAKQLIENNSFTN